jgi:hypothetical protein
VPAKFSVKKGTTRQSRLNLLSRAEEPLDWQHQAVAGRAGRHRNARLPNHDVNGNGTKGRFE